MTFRANQRREHRKSSSSPPAEENRPADKGFKCMINKQTSHGHGPTANMLMCVCWQVSVFVCVCDPTWQLTFKSVSEKCRKDSAGLYGCLGCPLGEYKRTKTVCVCVSFSPALWPRLFLLALSAERERSWMVLPGGRLWKSEHLRFLVPPPAKNTNSPCNCNINTS